MARHLFIGQQTLGTWLDQDKIDFQDNVMTIKADGRRFKLVEAVRFIKVEGDEPDASGLLGRVKTDEQLGQMGAERYRDSVIYGDVAYKVQEGFIGEVCLPEPERTRAPAATSGQVQQPQRQSAGADKEERPAQAIPSGGSGSRQAPGSGARRGSTPQPANKPDEDLSDEELLVRFLLDNTLK